MKRYFLPTGAFFGFLAVILGAFGAHFVKNHLSIEMFDIYKTATLYLFFHALALLIIGSLNLIKDSCSLSLAGRMMVTGTIIFCGSLYLYAFTEQITFARVTPFGGALLVIGWFLFFINTLRYNLSEDK